MSSADWWHEGAFSRCHFSAFLDSSCSQWVDKCKRKATLVLFLGEQIFKGTEEVSIYIFSPNVQSKFQFCICVKKETQSLFIIQHVDIVTKNICYWDMTLILIMFGRQRIIFDPNMLLCNSYSSFFDEWILGWSGSWGVHWTMALILAPCWAWTLSFCLIWLAVKDSAAFPRARSCRQIGFNRYRLTLTEPLC